MKYLSRTVTALLVAAALVMVGAGLYYGGVWGTGALNAAAREPAGLIVIGTLVLLFSARIVANGAVRAQRHAAEEARRRRLEKVYAELLAMEMDSSDPFDESAERMMLEMRLLVGASPEILGAYANARLNDEPAVGSLMRLAAAMREDLGLEAFHAGESGASGLLAELLDEASDAVEDDEEQRAGRRRDARRRQPGAAYRKERNG